MDKNPVTAASRLHEIIDQKITGLMREMVDADWNADEVAQAIREVIDGRWLAQKNALQGARDAVSTDFISDGNEG